MYDGEPDDLTAWLESRGVNVIFPRVSFYEKLKSFYSPELLTVASGAFLRYDIPLLEKEESIILYTDCDVLFLQSVSKESLPEPEFFSCATESGADDWSVLNTGVMLMNIPNLRKSHDDFCEFISQNIDQLDTYDQTAFNIYYGDKNTRLPLEYNWKPCWGCNEQTKIIHFHGPKPKDMLQLLRHGNVSESYLFLFNMNRTGCIHYLSRFCEYAEDENLNVKDILFESIAYLDEEISHYEQVFSKKNQHWTRGFRKSIHKRYGCLFGLSKGSGNNFSR